MGKSIYQIQLEEKLEIIEKSGKRPTLLLHSCCGPCSSYCLSYLNSYFDITVFYYNPNIYPEEEYLHRLSEQERLINEMNDEGGPEIKLIKGDWDHDEFLKWAEGLEGEREGGARCSKCFELRLLRTMQLAKKMGFEYFATTLTVSPHKNAVVINELGASLIDKETIQGMLDLLEEDKNSEKRNLSASKNDEDESIALKWLPSDFKKREGYKKSIELSKKYNLYRQEFCGCEFSS